MAIGKKTGGGPRGPNKTPPNIKELTSRYSVECVKSLANIAIKSKNEGNRIAAASELLNRAYGKPSQAIAGDPDQPVKLEISWIK